MGGINFEFWWGVLIVRIGLGRVFFYFFLTSRLRYLLQNEYNSRWASGTSSWVEKGVWCLIFLGLKVHFLGSGGYKFWVLVGCFNFRLPGTYNFPPGSSWKSFKSPKGNERAARVAIFSLNTFGTLGFAGFSFFLRRRIFGVNSKCLGDLTNYSRPARPITHAPFGVPGGRTPRCEDGIGWDEWVLIIYALVCYFQGC